MSVQASGKWNIPAGTFEFKGKLYYWFDDNHIWELDPEYGWKIVDPPQGIKEVCICDINDLMAKGCDCGAISKD